MDLAFDHGTVLVKGDIGVPNSTWDDQFRSFRAIALYYKDIIDFLKTSGFEFNDVVLNLLPCPESKAALRDHQKQALDEDQWRTRLKKEFKVEVGVLGGGEWDIKALTVSTYDSAGQDLGSVGYIQTVQALDAPLGQLAEACQRNGIVLAITADHGMSFPAPGKSKGAHASGKYSTRLESLRIPLVVRGPGVDKHEPEWRVVPG